MLDARSDVVGSLLRPQQLLEARERYAAGELTPAEFKPIEDAAVDDALRRQEAAGLEVVTDGEMRRLSFQSQLAEAVEGLGDWDLDAFMWGTWHGTPEVGDQRVERPSLAVVDRLRRRRFPTAEEFTYLRGRTDRTIKVTLPSPSLFASFYDSERAPACYPTVDAYLADVADLVKEEADELVGLGATYLQLDAPHYTLFVDRQYREFYASKGIPAERWIARGIDLDNHVIGDRPGVTFAFHLCRGNQASRWLVAGGYKHLAEEVFPRVAAGRLMLEYDDERSGGFEPLTAVPDDKQVVLGLVSTKTAEVEPLDTLVSRVVEATRYLMPDRLAVSTQCGFATSVRGNTLTVDEQQAKLVRVAELADAVWV